MLVPANLPTPTATLHLWIRADGTGLSATEMFPETQSALLQGNQHTHICCKNLVTGPTARNSVNGSILDKHWASPAVQLSSSEEPAPESPLPGIGPTVTLVSLGNSLHLCAVNPHSQGEEETKIKPGQPSVLG